MLPKGAEAEEPPRSVQGSAPGREAHPLLGAFPLAVMTLATFLVLFALMMARLNGGTDPDLSASTSTPLVARSLGGGAVTTLPGGGGASSAIAFGFRHSWR